MIAPLVPLVPLVALVALAGGGCSGSSERTELDTPQLRRGRQVYLERGCDRCHGRRAEGTRTAPPLEGLGAAWSAEPMKAFLQDPRGSVEGSSRLAALDERYMIEMPPVSGLSEDDLDALVAYLLSGPAEG